MKSSDARIALVHERFTDIGGSEKVVAELHRLWPTAPIHVPIMDRSVLPDGLVGADIRRTPLQRFYRGGRGYSHLLPLLPLAMRSIDVGPVDLAVVSHHAFAHRVRVPAGVPMLAYVHTPARWMWEARFRETEVPSRIGRAGLGAFSASQRRADAAAGRRIHTVVANSRHVAARVQRYWGRSAEVVAPPIDAEFFCPDPSIEREDWFLLAGRLVAYKSPHLAAAAARRAGVRLKVAGHGRAHDSVVAAGGDAVEMLGTVDDETMRDLFRRCRALIFPGEEDFGMVPVEAMACGAPVIALGRGGILDSVVDGETGILVDEPDPEQFAAVLASFGPDALDSSVIAARGQSFGADRFRTEIEAVADRILAG